MERVGALPLLRVLNLEPNHCICALATMNTQLWITQLACIASTRTSFSTVFLSCWTLRRLHSNGQYWSVVNTDWWSTTNVEYNPEERVMWMTAHLLGK